MSGTGADSGIFSDTRKFFCKSAFRRKATPLLGRKPFLDRFLKEGPKPILKIQKPPPGGLTGKLNNLNRGGRRLGLGEASALRLYRLPFTSARLRCAGPCQFRCQATWPPSIYRHPS